MVEGKGKLCSPSVSAIQVLEESESGKTNQVVSGSIMDLPSSLMDISNSINENVQSSRLN